MKLVEALEVLRDPMPSERMLRAFLACGFTPLHLETLVAAELRVKSPDSGVHISTGLFGDLLGNLQRAEEDGVDAVIAIVEWGDVDPRLSLRTLGGWRAQDVGDILESASERLDRLAAKLRQSATRRPVICCVPTLPLPPLFHTTLHEAGPQELHLRSLIVRFAESVADSGARIVSAQRIDELSPLGNRFDVKAELASGFPYTVEHAAAVASCIAAVFDERQPKKGLITDLDDTLWSGLVGEVGPTGVGWTLDDGAQSHGVYQQLLGSLASAGVLVAVTSKNEPDVVEEMFRRGDLLLTADDVYPMEVSWGSKAAAVRRILEKWNVGADSVVFVDDSPAEVAEVQAAFPEIEAIVFPAEIQAGAWDVIRQIRNLFGKSSLSEEDAIRMASIRTTDAMRSEEADDDGRGYTDDFLRSAQGSLVFALAGADDERALELINKTNQFNLNGRRLTRPQLQEFLSGDGTFLLTITYKDRFGPLGKIGAVLGTSVPGAVTVTTWVLSCRAFSRRIEHHCLAHLFEHFDADTVALDFEPTPRNAVLREFVTSFDGGTVERGLITITRAEFEDHVPTLPHAVECEA